MKIGPFEQLIMIIALAVVVVIAAAVLLVVPQYQSVADLNTKIDKARSEQLSANMRLATLEAAKSKAAETDAKWLRLANLVPDNPDLPSLIVELQDAAFASGVQLTAVSPGDVTAATDHYSIPLSLQVIGTWSDTVDYLQRVLKLNRGLRVVSSQTARTTDIAQVNKENASIPAYAVSTIVKVEVYMIPSAPSGSSSTSAAPVPAPAGQ